MEVIKNWAIVSMLFVIFRICFVSVRLWNDVCSNIPAKDITLRRVLKLDENPENDTTKEFLALLTTAISGMLYCIIFRWARIEQEMDLKLFIILYVVFFLISLYMLLGEIFLIPHYRAYKFLKKLRNMSLVELYAENFLEEEAINEGISGIIWAEYVYSKFKSKIETQYYHLSAEKKSKMEILIICMRIFRSRE